MKASAFVVIAIVAGAITLTAADELAPPESVGFSADGLKTFQQAMRALVDEGKLANVETLVARHGKVVQLDAYGVQNLTDKKPVTPTTIFRLASMTKPIVGVADDDVVGTGQVDARRSRRETHP